MFITKRIEENNAFYFFRGRVALYAILKALNIQKGDEIILQAFTCLAVPSPIIFLGAKPVYVDIDPQTFNMDVSRIEGKITPKTKAIIVQHTFGIPTEMDKILEVAKKHNLYIIEDSCHSFASKYNGQEVGSFGDASFFSFEWGKPLIIGRGGCAVINNQEIKKKIEKIYPNFISPTLKEVAIIHLQYVFYSLLVRPSTFWLIRDIYRNLSKSGFFSGTFLKEELRGQKSPDYKKRMSGFHKKMLLNKLKRIQKSTNRRKSITFQYEKFLSQIGIRLINFDKRFEPVYLRYPLLVRNKNTFIEESQKAKVEFGDWYISPVHPLVGENLRTVGYQKGMCPVAEEVSEKIITLPIYEKVKEKNIKKTIDFLNKNKEKIIQSY